jgi:hypothetical protein
MATTRTLSNVGSPLMTPNGTPFADAKITFTLVGTPGSALGNVFDAISGERVAGQVTTTTDANGQFTVQLWPNDRGATTTQYLCHVDALGIADFKASVPSGATTLTWVAFMAQGTVLTPAQIATLEYIANRDVSGGYAGLTLFKINFMNALGTVKSWFTNSNTAPRTYTFQDRDGTIADNTDIASREATANKGAANGYAPLDAGAKIPLANLPVAIAGAMSYQGVWNATTNSPALASGVGTKGYYYKVSVAGTTNLDGNAVWTVNDVAVFDGVTWDILQGGITSGEVITALGYTPENATATAQTIALSHALATMRI